MSIYKKKPQNWIQTDLESLLDTTKNKTKCDPAIAAMIYTQWGQASPTLGDLVRTPNWTY